MSSTKHEVVKASSFEGLGVPEFDTLGKLTKDEVTAIAKTREEFVRQTVAIQGQEAKERMAAEAVGRMYVHAAEVYTDSTGRMLQQIDFAQDKVHASYVSGFVLDQCEELQRDLKGIVKLGVREIATEVDRSLYQPPQEKKGWFR